LPDFFYKKGRLFISAPFLFLEDKLYVIEVRNFSK